MLFGTAGERRVPVTDVERGPLIARKVHAAIADGLVASAHDCSDGGLLVAAAEMAMAGGLGLELETIEPASCFSEEPSRYLLEVAPNKLGSLRAGLEGLPCVALGSFNDSARLTMPGGGLDLALEKLNEAWLGTLDW
jgi:phosphoribosylformylglycinamidine synthase